MKCEHWQKMAAALRRCRELEADMATDAQRLAALTEERLTLETGVDLADTAALTRIAQLQVATGLAPQRTAVRQVALEAGRKELLEASHEFVRKELRPRCLRLRELSNARVKESLRPHFKDEAGLATAVQGSAAFLALQKIERQAVITVFRTDECQKKAEELMRAWEAADVFEKEHLN
jgi:hypothetical protein